MIQASIKAVPSYGNYLALTHQIPTVRIWEIVGRD